MTFLSYLISGVSLGSIYAIIALGYTMVYGIAKMLNFAHGDVIMVGAYISFCTTSYLGLSPFISVLFSIIVCTALGIVVERLAYKPCGRHLPWPYSLQPSAYLTFCRMQPCLYGDPAPKPFLP